VTRLLIANRGEIALRIIRTATELELGTVAVYAEDDADSPHVHAADEAIALPGAGPSAYLDHAAILAAAKNSGAELVHPGYGFLSEQPEFARACASAGFTFVGPDAAALDLFGNKASGGDGGRRPGATCHRRAEQRRRDSCLRDRPGRPDRDQGAFRRRRSRHANRPQR
jgi:acetyl/propionyl-CoA carboxylase alpha subunit